MRKTTERTVSTLLTLVFILALAACGKMPDTADASKSDDTPAADASGGERLPFSGREARGKTSSVPEQFVIPAGTMIPVRLQSGVSSATAQSGEHFDAVLDDALIINGRTVAHRGDPVVGRVVQARKSGRLHNSGYLRLTIASITVNGKELPVQASSIFVEGGAHKKRNLALIGGGAGAGALIGALAGGGKGALIGSAVGAGAGTTGAYATGKKEVGFGPERRLSFRLTQPVKLG